MEFQLDTWLELFTHRLLDNFPGRVIFSGIQGSRGRGDSKPDSDIDLVVVLSLIHISGPRGPGLPGGLPRQVRRPAPGVCSQAALPAWKAGPCLLYTSRCV